MTYKWGMLKGEMDSDEQKFMQYIAGVGLIEADFSHNQNPSPQSQGAIESFRTLQNFICFDEFKQYWEDLDEGLKEYKYAGSWSKRDLNFCERLRGQKAQVEFILDRLLAWQVRRSKLKHDDLNAKAVVSVADYLKKLEAGQI